jgi:hypothetical protein
MSMRSPVHALLFLAIALCFAGFAVNPGPMPGFGIIYLDTVTTRAPRGSNSNGTKPEQKPRPKPGSSAQMLGTPDALLASSSTTIAFIPRMDMRNMLAQARGYGDAGARISGASSRSIGGIPAGSLDLNYGDRHARPGGVSSTDLLQ